MAAWASSGHQLRYLEAPNTLLEVATRRARNGDLRFLATGPDATSLAMAQNTAHMLARLGLQNHTVLLTDSLDTCERVGERIFGADACYWTSRMLGVMPSGSVSLKRYWDWRFKFYWAKKHYMAELLRLGFSVLQAPNTLLEVATRRAHTRGCSPVPGCVRTQVVTMCTGGCSCAHVYGRLHPLHPGGHRHGVGARPFPGAAPDLPGHQCLAGAPAGFTQCTHRLHCRASTNHSRAIVAGLGRALLPNPARLG